MSLCHCHTVVMMLLATPLAPAHATKASLAGKRAACPARAPAHRGRFQAVNASSGEQQNEVSGVSRRTALVAGVTLLGVSQLGTVLPANADGESPV